MMTVTFNESNGNITLEEGFGFTNITEAVEFQDFGIYRDITESSLLFRDLLLKRIFAPP